MSGNDGSFFAELKRRNVYRVGLAYAIASWLFLQALDLIVSLADAPDWIGKLFLGLLLVGLPIVLILSWVYELTPEGIKREKDVDRSASITAKTGSRLDKTIIGVFVVAAAWVVIDLTLLNEQTDPVPAPTQQDEIVATEAASTPGDRNHSAGQIEQVRGLFAHRLLPAASIDVSGVRIRSEPSGCSCRASGPWPFLRTA